MKTNRQLPFGINSRENRHGGVFSKNSKEYINNERKKITMSKNKVSDYWNMGSSIGLCAAVGVVLGALFQNIILWLCIGAGIGVVLGAVSMPYKQKKS
jgi:hypothetical protein